MNPTARRRAHAAGIAIALLLAGTPGETPAARVQDPIDVSGTWDAHFSGTVRGTGGSQTDDFVMEFRQSGTEVTGTLRIRGLDLVFPVSGTVSATSFRYSATGGLTPDCPLTVEADTIVDPAAGRFVGVQTQSNCEGTAVGQVTAIRRTLLPEVGHQVNNPRTESGDDALHSNRNAHTAKTFAGPDALGPRRDDP